MDRSAAAEAFLDWTAGCEENTPMFTSSFNLLSLGLLLSGAGEV